LSETVPEKLPVAWPKRSGQSEKTRKQQQPTSSTFLFSIRTPFGGPQPNAKVLPARES
jgi:hypothetical protein